MILTFAQKTEDAKPDGEKKMVGIKIGVVYSR